MELIKELGSRSWINGSGKKDSSKYGLFLCPSCNKEVEKALRKGIIASSCGSRECRKSTFKANPNNKGNFKENRISDIKYYNAIKERYRQICLNYKICEEWKVFKNFVKDMHQSYIDCRNFSDRLTFIVYDENKILDKNNCEFKPSLKYHEYPNSVDNEKKYIYIVNADVYTKIGITNNIGSRMCSIQTCNPFVIDLVFATEIENAFNVEQDIHLSLKEYNVNGEWFKLTAKQVDDIISYILSLKNKE